MLSAVIRSEHSYPAVPLAGQQVHQRSVRSGPLVLRTKPFKNQRLQQIGDQPVLQRSEPSSRTTLIGEQPNPWDLLQPRDVVSRHRRMFSFVTESSGLYLHPFRHRRMRSWRLSFPFAGKLYPFWERIKSLRGRPSLALWRLPTVLSLPGICKNAA